MNIGVADYGMNVWEGALYDYEMRLSELNRIGYDGIERLEAQSPTEALQKAARAHQMGMDFATCRGTSLETTI